MPRREKSYHNYTALHPDELQSCIHKAALQLLRKTALSERQYKSVFGADKLTIAFAWKLTLGVSTYDDFPLPKHMLWAMMFLKQYVSEDNLSIQAGVTPKTLRKHICSVLTKLVNNYDGIVSCLHFTFFL